MLSFAAWQPTENETREQGFPFRGLRPSVVAPPTEAGARRRGLRALVRRGGAGGILVAGLATLLLCPLAAASEGLDAVDRVLEGYVERGKLAGVVALVARQGEVVHLRAYGRRRVDASEPMQTDDGFRIASMTKPVVSVAAMILVERGVLDLDAPVARYLPEFATTQVYESERRVRPPKRPMRIVHLLTHTSGLTGSFEDTPLAALLRASARPRRTTLAEFARDLAGLPLETDPGERWIYGFSTNVLGRVIEVASGLTLDRFLEREVFAPLGMTRTGFSVPKAAGASVAAVHAYDVEGQLRVVPERAGRDVTLEPTFLSANGGLISTAEDYFRFTQLLLNGGELRGRRVLGEASVRAMTSNQLAPQLLPWGVGELRMHGEGFGFGFAVVLDRAAARHPASNGAYYWAGSGNTSFWVDPTEQLVGVLLAQLEPFRVIPIEREFQVATYAALAGDAQATNVEARDRRLVSLVE